MTEYRVLVVDDDPEVREALVDELGESFHVAEADSGENAIAILDGERFDAVVSDVRMPGMGGVALLEHLAKERPEMVRIFLTGFGDERVANAARATGAFKLRKPWGDELEILLRHALSHREQHRRMRDEVLDYVCLVGRPEPSVDADRVVEQLRLSLLDLEWVVDVRVSRLDVAPTGTTVTGAQAPDPSFDEPGQMTVLLGAPEVGGWVLQVWWRANPFGVRLIDYAIQQARDALEMRRLTNVVKARMEELESVRHEMASRDRLAAMGALAASLAHDVRSPLHALGQCLELLEEELGPKSTRDVKELLEDGRIAHETITRVVESMQKATSAADARERVGIAEAFSVIQRLMTRECRRRGAVLDVRPSHALAVKATTGEVCQILLNLVSNATRVSPEGGRIFVEATALEDGTVEIAVEDQGPGVPETERERIFAPFVTGNGDGMGLGLAISREMARRHGGQLGVSQGVVGARFTLTLPRWVEEPDAGARSG